MTNRQQRLARAVNVLSKYYGVQSVSDLASRIALDSLSATSSTRGASSEGPGDGDPSSSIRLSQIEKRLVEFLIDTTEGARTSVQLINDINSQINNAEAGDREALRTSFGQFLQIHYAAGADGALSIVVPEAINIPSEISSGDSSEPTTRPAEEITVLDMLGYGSGETRINSRPTEPSKENPGLSIILTNSPRVTLETQNASAATIFFNGVPSVELSRAVPYVNIDFFFPKPPLDSAKRLQTLSLNKFLFGAKVATEGSPLDVMAQANTTAGTLVSTQQEEPGRPIPEVYSSAGMELFTSPQTLVNANLGDTTTAEISNPVLDKFRPLMTLQDLSISVTPSAGMMSFKRGEMTIILHDRSRLPEVASFVRPDLYGSNEIQIEYGWSHPDAGLTNQVNASTTNGSSINPFADLIDGMRVKEKYMVVNSSFNFDNTGQIIIKLTIAMRGSAAFNTQLMSSDNESFGNLIAEIEELQSTIAELRERAFPPSTVSTTSEIRGHQILDAATDVSSHPNLTSDLRDALREFRAAYRNSTNPDARSLVERIEEIFGDEVTRRGRGDSTEPRRTSGEPTVIQRLRRSITDSISRKVTAMQNGPDPFLVDDHEIGGRRLLATGAASRRSRAESTRLTRFEETAFGVTITNHQPVSLAKLFLAFIGEPLANTGNYDDIQLVFYPFNEYAGLANGLNIGNFIVDVDFFADELARYRLEHIGHSAAMTLQEFTQFVMDTILDDPAAPSYGLQDHSGPLFESFVEDDGRVRTTRAADEAPDHQTRLQALLQNITPDGSFRMPQVGVYVEALPEIAGTRDGSSSEENNGKTILRLHVFDRQSSSYSSLGQLLSATRTATLQSVGRFPTLQGRNRGVREIREQIANATIAAAESTGIIERIPNPPPVPQAAADRQYRIIGGPQKIKEFIMENTPYIIYGAAGTTVKNAQLASLQESGLNTVNLIRSFRREENITPNGEDAGGLPMQIVPTQLSVECFGNPIIAYAQRFFVDFQTGTTADNFYSVVGMDHRFTQGDFTTSIRLGPDDAWGQYRSFIGSITNALDVLRDIENSPEGTSDGTSTVGG